MSSNTPSDEIGIWSSPVVADPVTSTQSERRSLPAQTDPTVDISNRVIDPKTPSLPGSDTGRGWSLTLLEEGDPTAMMLTSLSPLPRILTPSQPLTMSPECITEERPTQQPSNPQPTSQPSTQPNPTNDNPLSLLGKHYLTTPPQ